MMSDPLRCLNNPLNFVKLSKRDRKLCCLACGVYVNGCKSACYMEMGLRKLALRRAGSTEPEYGLVYDFWEKYKIFGGTCLKAHALSGPLDIASIGSIAGTGSEKLTKAIQRSSKVLKI